jgi:hypothetical protein
VGESDGRNTLKAPVLGQLALDLASSHANPDGLKILQAPFNPIRTIRVRLGSRCLNLRAEQRNTGPADTCSKDTEFQDSFHSSEPLIDRAFCPDNMILDLFSGSFALILAGSISGRKVQAFTRTI